MDKQKICYFISFITLIITTLFIILEIVFGENENSFFIYYIFDYMCVIFFPLLLYWSYLLSKRNKIFAFVLALLNDYTCFVLNIIMYHYTTDFEFVDDIETQGIIIIMIITKIIFTIIALIIYSIVLVYLPWKRNHLEKKKSHDPK